MVSLKFLVFLSQIFLRELSDLCELLKAGGERRLSRSDRWCELWTEANCCGLESCR